MKQSGLMGVQLTLGRYFVSLRGDSIEAWKDEEVDAFFVGKIDDLQVADRVLFQLLLDQGAIKAN